MEDLAEIGRDEMNVKITVAGYTRVSTQDQGTESLPDQEKRIKDYAKSHGYTIFKIYQDKESGAEENRAAFQEMIREAEEGKFQKIVFTNWDRFARDARDTLNYHHRLEKIGVALVCLALGIDTGTPEGKLVMTQSTAFSEYERKRIRERTQMGWLGKVRKGDYIPGKPPFGYRKTKGKNKIEVDDDEAEIYHQIIAMVLEGRSLYNISENLKNKPYHLSTSKLHSIIRNKAYIGDFVVKIQSGKEEVQHEIPPLITKKKWEEVNAKLSSNRSIPRGPSLQGNFLLKGDVRTL